VTAEQALIRIYRQAAARLRRQIAADLANDRIGTATYRSQQLASIQRELNALGQRTRALAQPASITEYLRGVRWVELNTPPALQQIAFSGTHRRAAETLAHNLSGRLQLTTTVVGRRVEDVYRHVGLEVVSEGVVEGATRREVSAQLRQQLIRDGVTDATTGFIDAAGRRWPLDTYAEMAVRTGTREAMSAGMENRLAETGEDLVTISDHNTECEICKPYEGETFSISGNTPGYDVLPEWPPFHPNCMHYATPGSGDLEADIQALNREFEDPEQVQRHVERVLRGGLVPA